MLAHFTLYSMRDKAHLQVSQPHAQRVNDIVALRGDERAQRAPQPPVERHMSQGSGCCFGDLRAAMCEGLVQHVSIQHCAYLLAVVAKPVQQGCQCRQQQPRMLDKLVTSRPRCNAEAVQNNARKCGSVCCTNCNSSQSDSAHAFHMATQILRAFV